MRKTSAEQSATLAPLWAAAMHDLSQPVQALALHSRLACGARDLEHRHESLHYIEAAVRGLQAMIGTLRELAVIEAGVDRLDVRRFDLSDVLRRIEAEFAVFRFQCGRRPGTPSAAILVVAHEPLIEAVLRGLIAQAVKYGTGATIELGGRPDHRHPGETYAVIECCFDGPPLGPARRREVFLDMSATRDGDVADVAVLPGFALLERCCALLNADLSVQTSPGQTSAGSRQCLTVTLAGHPA